MLARTGLELTQRRCSVSYVSGLFNAGEISESFRQTGLPEESGFHHARSASARALTSAGGNTADPFELPRINPIFLTGRDAAAIELALPHVSEPK